MDRFDAIHGIADRQLGGLKANSAMLAQIRIRAAEEKMPKKTFPWKPVVGVASAMACIVLALAVLPAESPFSSGKSLFASRSAGDAVVTATEEPSSLTEGMITMSSGNTQNALGLFEESGILTVHEAAYQLLSEPAKVSNALLGDTIGNVEEFNSEPALGTGNIVSNIVQCGTAVYPVQGMKSSLLAAEVNGTLRLFQRVGYAGTAIIGSETLADVLCSSEDVAWIATEDVRITDGARELMDILLKNADYEGTALTAGSSLQIGLKNGCVLQLFMSDDCVSACGTWCCPEFFDALRIASGN